MSSMIEARGARTSDGTNIGTHHEQRIKEARRNLLSASGASPPGAPSVTGTWPIVAARPGDQHLACQLLASVQRAPSPTEFQSQQDDPWSDPADRLFCRVHGRVVGHARLIKRKIQFGTTVLPVAQLGDFLVLPEYRNHGCGSDLLSAAERQATAAGAILGVIRTDHPHFFLRRGWAVWSRYSYSTARTRDILSQLLENQPARRDGDERSDPEINIRCWRHIELTGLVRLYNEFTGQSFGSTVRTEDYWHWLVSRRAFDRIFVAINGPDSFELDAGAAAIVGYAVMKESRILELVVSPKFPQAATQLLARACSDTIEQDGNYVRLEAPSADPLHQILVRAGGTVHHHESVQGEASLVKVLDIEQTVVALGEQLRERARRGSIPLPFELGLRIDGGKFCLELRPRSVRIRAARRGRSYLETGLLEWTQLLLGHLDLRSAIAAGRVVASTRVAAESAATLFPPLPLWRPPLDELPAR
jgi:GNAT superfamily N-acetyltransferase